MTNAEMLKTLKRRIERDMYVMEKMICETFEKIEKENEMTEKWHDLRKDPTDLPKDTNTVWVILSETPTEVDMDSYNPENKGKIMTVPAYDTETDDGNIEHHESRQYKASGWWAYDEPGWITHWMYINVPEPPEE